MDIYRRIVSFLIFAAIFLIGCQQAKIVGPIKKNEDAPDQIDNIEIESIPGGARIDYSIPKGSGVFYVEADYYIGKEEKRQVKSSFYNNSIIVNGFGDTLVHQVKLFSVSRNEKRSNPISVKVKPLMPSLIKAYGTLSYTSDFGGLHATFQNIDLADLIANVIFLDSTNNWVNYDKFYSSLKDNEFSVRGLPPILTTFGIYFQDEWGNYSDTLIKQITPIFEELLDKSKFKDMSPYLPGTPAIYSSSYRMTNMWDDNINDLFHTTQDFDKGTGFPLRFAFDLGVETKLSRMKLWPRQGQWIFSHGNIKDAIIYGTNRDPSTWSPFDLNDWIKLGEFHSHKPSGLPLGQNSQEDIDLAAAGEDMEFPIEDPSVRYIMFYVIDNWSQPPGSEAGFVHVAEISFWGQPEH